MQIVYIANDGTEFDDMDECLLYESLDSAKGKIDNIVFFDLDGNEFSVSDCNDIEDVYGLAEKVIINDDEELKAFLNLTEVRGWCEFEQIDSVGTWKRYEHNKFDVKWLKDKE